jgi:hypothetical protein
LLLAVHGEITEERTVNFGCEAEKPVLNIKHYYTWDGLPASACTFCLNSQWMRDSKALSDCKALDSLPHPHNSTMDLSRLHEVTGFYERSLRPGDGERYRRRERRFYYMPRLLPASDLECYTHRRSRRTNSASHRGPFRMSGSHNTIIHRSG